VSATLDEVFTITLRSPDTPEQLDLLTDNLRFQLDTARNRASMMSKQTGLSLTQALDLEFSKTDAYNLQKAFDAAAGMAMQREVYEAGRGIFPRKVAIPTLDNETTDLCRNRMAFQVRAWDEMFVDEVSGAQWLFPPFIGAGLDRHEEFHFCRTFSVPR
jgi:hypothetical protein